MDKFLPDRKGIHRLCSPNHRSFRAGPQTGVRIPPDERYSGTISLAPRIYEGGGPRSGRGSLPAAAGTALSVTASPCQLSQRESQGSFAPFLPPAFMRGEGHAVAGGVLRRSRDGPLSHGFAVPALPEGEPGGCAPFLPPAFMRGEGHAVAGGVSPPQRGRPSQSRCAVPAPPRGEPRALRTDLAPRIYEGGGPRSGRGSPPAAAGKPSQSRLRRASSPRGRAKGAAHRSCPPHL